MYAIVTTLILILSVSGEKSCKRNADLIQSIQYQLKLVAENGRSCNCGTGQVYQRIGFLSTNSKSISNIPANTVVVFDTALTNAGNGYDQNDGIFTAPVEGLYSFSWTILTQRSGFQTYLDVNGKDMGRNLAGPTCYSFNTSGSQSVVVHLMKDDRVCIKTFTRGTHMYGGTWTTFSGFYIA